ncbi:hypothetical protein [Bradyrhizobium elkanii]|uniref:hypothetical protein n=1 Tax=Bradyrhizobium elkanii TaxID=29448 RepID=UPI00209CB42C|nr:hypothetical protein [Bradyrhizobium elkanii]MCP1975659.1 hypothetical protein [Bradyrhizobium elkanii]MCS3482423.1 hypothetical protein [Bradyrhizobium elkanii]MCS3525197.1 hypothetical protein [Bradyrhizobium elkanii]MCS4075900.1 hypothetical protein [Bradyrhizobium elkanii]MCS4085160.1 hypothetical protein [Bradyrhizobium elkanii]
MTVPVWITVDFFFRDWDKQNADSALWLCVQPHVEQSRLQDWIGACNSLSGTQHQLWTNANPIDPKTLIPVPLPGDTNIRIALKRGAHPIVDRLNDRRTGPNLTNPAIFSDLNRVPQPTNPPPPSPPPMNAGPFARVFTDALIDAYQGIAASDPSAKALDTIADQLQLAFHGGTTRHFSNQCLDQLNAVDLFELDPATEHVPSGVRIANQHSLLGLQFLLAKRSNAGVLATPGPTSFMIELTGDNGAKVDLDVVASIPTPGDLDKWLDWFGQPGNVSSAGSITADVLPGLDQRVYVQDAPEAFAQLAANSPFWRRRTQEAGAGRSVADVKRLVVRPAKQTDTTALTAFRVQPYVALDCELKGYRSSQVGPNSGPLQLRPKPQSRARFASSFAALAQPPGMVVLGTDATPVTSLTWLGAYTLPWDAIDDQNASGPTVLFWGLPPDNDVTVLVPAGSGNISCPWVDDGDQLGRRWEARQDPHDPLGSFPPPIGDLPFDALQLVDTVDNVIPGITFPFSLNFASARSVEAIEGVLRMTYPHRDVSTRGDPPDDYAGDLVNYNALNVRYAQTNACSGTLLNPDGYDFAVWHQQINNTVEQTFHYRFGLNSDPDITQEIGLDDTKKFFRAQFESVGAARPLDFELVHTYGTSICFGRLDNAANPHARLPLLPNEVATQASGAANTSFLTIDYAKAGSSDVITLHFDLSVFNAPVGSGDAERSQRMRMFSAFRSIAEIGYASSAKLTVRGCTFDYSKLVGKGLRAPLAYGLVDNQAANQWTHDLSQLADQCRKYLAGTSTSLDLTIALTPSQSATFRNCNLLEFSIEVARTAGAAPVIASQVALLRISTALGKNPDGSNAGYDRDGQRTTPAESQAVTAYPAWRSAMISRTRPIVPTRSNSQIIRDVFASGSDPKTPNPNSGASWLAPPDAPAVAGDWPDLYVFPLGFLPLARSGALGAATTAVTRRFFDALAFVIDARPGAWNEGWTISNWRTHFSNLQTAAGNLTNAQRKALSLLQPANDPDSLDQTSPVTTQIRNFDITAPRWAAAKEQLVVAAPGLFGSAKGVQITALGNSGANLRADLFRISQKHQIPAPPAEGTSTPRATEVLRSSDIRQGVPDPGNTGLFLGLDVLDDVSYGDRYVVSEPKAQSFESLIDPASTPAKGHTPQAFVPRVNGKPTDPVVALPSREPLTPPQHLFTGVVDGATTPEWWNVKDTHGNVLPISASQLVAHHISHHPSSTTDELAFIAGGSQPRSAPPPASRVDRSIVCGVFSVSSDEEGSFDNDTFSLRYDPALAPDEAPPEDNKPIGLFHDLVSIPVLENIPKLDEVTTNTNISLISAALSPALAATAVPSTACRISVKGSMLTIDPATTGENDGYCISAALYRQTMGTGVHRAFLIVALEVPVWTIVKLGLYHSRDIVGPGAGVPPFAAAFGQTLGPVGGAVSFINEQEARLSGSAPISLSAQNWTTEDLIREVLANRQIIDSKQWAGIVAEVTIHHRQTVALLADDGSASPNQALNLDTGSRFALVRSEFVPGKPQTPSALFPSTYKDFSVDFIWHTQGNEFFRIMDVPISI